MRRLLAGILVLGSLLAGGAASAATPSPETCVVEGATLDWGFKESFRAYIDGSIANGEWTTADGATYDTPTFSWSAGTGEVTPGDLSGEIAFTGSVRFTGHGGILDTTIANPVIRFDDAQHATLLLDVTGETMAGDPYAQTAVPFVELDLSPVGVLARRDDVVGIDAAPTTLTAEGAVAFPNYETGSDFDPISVEFGVASGCTFGEGVIGDATPFVAVILALGIGLVVVLVVVVVVIVRRRRRTLGA